MFLRLGKGSYKLRIWPYISTLVLLRVSLVNIYCISYNNVQCHSFCRHFPQLFQSLWNELWLYQRSVGQVTQSATVVTLRYESFIFVVTPLYCYRSSCTHDDWILCEHQFYWIYEQCLLSVSLLNKFKRKVEKWLWCRCWCEYGVASSLSWSNSM